MKVGVFTVILGQEPLDKTLKFLKSIGVEAVELGTGAYPGDAHCPLDHVLSNKNVAKDLKKLITDEGFEISSLSCHGNPLHPNETISKEHIRVFRNTLKLCEIWEVPRITTFSGCPGDHKGAKFPNWVTCPWPNDFLEILDWQWNHVAIPYWEKEAALAAEYGVKQIALEMHPGFLVYNPETLLKLRKAAGKAIGANFDPSHLFWQGIDPCRALRELKGAVWHVHAKDSKVYEENSLTNGVLDTKPYSDEINRSWIFRAVGYGHGPEFWAHFVSTLRMIGYDGVLSMEHEDSLMTPNEGLKKAVAFLNNIITHEAKGKVSWA